MGGRGAKIDLKRNKVAKTAIIPRNKFKNYLLNPTKSNGKHAVFADLGYNMGNWKRLEKDMRKELDKSVKNGKLIRGEIDSFGGRRYRTEMTLGINKKRQIFTAWVVKDKTGVLHFVTAFPKK